MKIDKFLSRVILSMSKMTRWYGNLPRLRQSWLKILLLKAKSLMKD